MPIHSVVNAASALPEVVGEAGVAVSGTPAGFADGVRSLLGRPEVDRRAAARARAERFGWPQAVDGFLRAHGARTSTDPARPAPVVGRQHTPTALRPAVPVRPEVSVRGPLAWASMPGDAVGAENT